MAAIGRAIRRWWRDEPVTVPTGVYAERMSICNECSFYVDSQCLKCNCLMEIKAWFAAERCADHPPRWTDL